MTLEKDVVIPIYARIALDIATRIARGILKEQTKIYGRSVMSSEYGVSPETIRRAMKLLADMEIVEIKQNSGTVVLSVEKAQKYVDLFGEKNNPRLMKKKLSDLANKQKEINSQIIDIANSIVKMNDKYSETNPFQNYEAEIVKPSGMIGCTLAELNFWQETRATVIAIRRDNQIILSPGPYITFETGDSIIFVGDVTCVDAVNEYITRDSKK